MHRPIPLTRDLVLIGGGHTHALVLRNWGMKPVPGVRVTVVNPSATAAYSGMLPGFIAGHYALPELELDLVRLARFAGARLVRGVVSGIDRTAREVLIPGRPPLRYDIASLDVGVSSRMPDLPGFADHGVAAKPLMLYARAWEAFCTRVAEGRAPPEVVVIGAGIAGVELALAMHHRLSRLAEGPSIRIVDAGAALVGIAGGTRAILFERLRRADIAVMEHSPVAVVTASEVVLTNDRRLPAALTVGAAGARPWPWLADLGLTHEAGYVSVDADLRTLTDRQIYACGDCAHLSETPRPKAGVYAVRAAPVLAHNLRADLTGHARRRFRPQKDFLKLVSLGGRDAVADRSGLSLTGPWLWRQKDRIDRAFMDRLSDLPPMAPPPAPSGAAIGVAKQLGGQAPCAGCGAKVGPGALGQALGQLPAPERADVLSLPGDDAAILAMGDEWQVLTTDHLRALTDDPALFARIAATHAMGDIWAMGAAPQAALATVILPHMSEDMQRATLRELLEPAAEAFRAVGAELVGGHTTLGAELTLGFTITGLSGPFPITLGGGKPGDVLLLTRPIGTGVLLAAEMQGRAAGPDVAAMLDRMAPPQATAGRILAGARAMTDVTGFGLAGHLMAMCRASGCSARLDLSAVPLYPGVDALAAAGIRSTLAPANRAALDGEVQAPHGPRTDLLYDPQTAGGLLAAVPSADAASLRTKLAENGIDAACIGELMPGPALIVAE